VITQVELLIPIKLKQTLNARTMTKQLGFLLYQTN